MQIRTKNNKMIYKKVHLIDDSDNEADNDSNDETVSDSDNDESNE